MSSIEKNSSELNWLEIVKKQTSSLSFGIVVITVHNGTVVQIERTEKTRVEPARLEKQARSFGGEPRPKLPRP